MQIAVTSMLQFRIYPDAPRCIRMRCGNIEHIGEARQRQAGVEGAAATAERLNGAQRVQLGTKESLDRPIALPATITHAARRKASAPCDIRATRKSGIVARE